MSGEDFDQQLHNGSSLRSPFLGSQLCFLDTNFDKRRGISSLSNITDLYDGCMSS